VETLVLWVLGVLAADKWIAQSPIEALADIVMTRLVDEPVVLILQRVDHLAGGLIVFHRDFWAPLHDAMSARWKRNPRPHRFTLVIGLNEEVAKSSLFWDGKPDDDKIDFRRLLLLPPLGKLLKQDVSDWLHGLGLGRMRALEIAQQVIGKGDPLEVYEQLQEIGVWNEIIGERS
jgi:hypothetical protein